MTPPEPWHKCINHNIRVGLFTIVQNCVFGRRIFSVAVPAGVGMDKLRHSSRRSSADESACKSSLPWHASIQPVPG